MRSQKAENGDELDGFSKTTEECDFERDPPVRSETDNECMQLERRSNGNPRSELPYGIRRGFA